ncbi:biotin/lipoate A/B protein ligase family protein [Radiobacillus sp. PE A8.2]|uniref:lipoate--protein ligase family protein n=1 Tax=Radiobacillus sp. PE A8.2 TaxID=3380349 RepID=UPI00389020CF
MLNWNPFIDNSKCRLIDQSKPTAADNALASFAIDDALAISVGNNQSPPTIRLWVHNPSVILGIPDARLPYVHEAIDWIKQQGYKVIVRNSGGLAVLLDSGVLNMSLILPDVKRIGIRDGYEMLVSFIQAILSDLTTEIEAYEITGSYCPGDYDLSINGKKFAGISQRRVKNGIAVQIYLCVEGDGVVRAKQIREFYHLGLKDEKGRFVYPTIEPETMASLNQLISVKLTVEDVIERIEKGLKQQFGIIETNQLGDQEQQWYQERLKQMEERNTKALVDDK